MTAAGRESLGRKKLLASISSWSFIASLLALAYGVATMIDQQVAVRLLDSFLPILCVALVVASSLLGTAWYAMDAEAPTVKRRSLTFSTLGVSITAFATYVLLVTRTTG